MKFPENWLRSLVDIKADRAELAHRLTMAGLEVEGIEAYDASLAGVVVGDEPAVVIEFDFYKDTARRLGMAHEHRHS